MTISTSKAGRSAQPHSFCGSWSAPWPQRCMTKASTSRRSSSAPGVVLINLLCVQPHKCSLPGASTTFCGRQCQLNAVIGPFAGSFSSGKTTTTLDGSWRVARSTPMKHRCPAKSSIFNEVFSPAFHPSMSMAAAPTLVQMSKCLRRNSPSAAGLACALRQLSSIDCKVFAA